MKTVRNSVVLHFTFGKDIWQVLRAVEEKVLACALAEEKKCCAII